eukprot:m.159655 g.159655  ORF g.159655 m.159655 type:complete len:351 (+) comp23755_c0_seq1:137-1189(+)
MDSATVKQKRVRQVPQRQKVFRAPNPVISCAIWGLHHTMRELDTVDAQPVILPHDFKAYSKVSIDNHSYNNATLPAKFKIKAYCPIVFRDLRARFGEDPKAFLESWLSGPAEVHEQSSSRARTNVYSSHDRRMTMYEMRKEEVVNFFHLFQLYHAHIVENSGITALPHYLGLFRINMKDTWTYLMVTNNVQSADLHMDRLYDLKGSDRAASDKEKGKDAPILKDADFHGREEKLRIGPEARAAFIEVVRRDAEFLARAKLMDYSLFVGIHEYDGVPPLVDVTRDVHALGSPGPHSELYFVGIVDVLTKYGAKKSIAANVKKLGGAKGEITTVSPDNYMARFCAMVEDITE